MVIVPAVTALMPPAGWSDSSPIRSRGHWDLQRRDPGRHAGSSRRGGHRGTEPGAERGAEPGGRGHRSERSAPKSVRRGASTSATASSPSRTISRRASPTVRSAPSQRVLPTACVITFSGPPSRFRSRSWSDLRHGWAITVHRAQGSEWPAVVVVLPPESGGLLTRPLVYTALTRAQRHLSVVPGAWVRALARAVRENGGRQRITRLPRLLLEAFCARNCQVGEQAR